MRDVVKAGDKQEGGCSPSPWYNESAGVILAEGTPNSTRMEDEQLW